MEDREIKFGEHIIILDLRNLYLVFLLLCECSDTPARLFSLSTLIFVCICDRMSERNKGATEK